MLFRSDQPLEAGRPRPRLVKYVATVDGSDHAVDVQRGEKPGAFSVTLSGKTHQVDLERTARGWLYSLLIDGHSFEIVQAEGVLQVNGQSFTVEVERDLGLQRAHGSTAGGPAALKAPIPGLVVAVRVKAGDLVETGQALVIVEAMKMQMELKSPRAGQVSEVHAEPGQEVNRGQILAVIADPV